MRFFTLEDAEIEFRDSTIQAIEKFIEICKEDLKVDFLTLTEETMRDIGEAMQQLDSFHENGAIEDGLKYATQAWAKYPHDSIILKHYLRFMGRLKEYATLLKLIEDLFAKNELNIQQQEVAYLAKVEAMIKKSYRDYGEKDKEKYRETLLDVEELFVNIAESARTEQFYYWKGRVCLELVWCGNNERIGELKRALTILRQGLSFGNNRYWIRYYECLALKMLERQEFKTSLEEYMQIISDKLKDKPNQPAVIVYYADGLLLSDDAKALEKFLDQYINKPILTNFLSSAYKTVDMAYENQHEKITEYKSLLNNFSKKADIQ